MPELDPAVGTFARLYRADHQPLPGTWRLLVVGSLAMFVEQETGDVVPFNVVTRAQRWAGREDTPPPMPPGDDPRSGDVIRGA